MAHNFRAPLRAIAGFSEFLREKISADDREADDYISRISLSAASLDKLVNDLLVFGAISRADIKMEKIALFSTIKAAIADLKEEIEERRAEIGIHDDLPIVLGDRGLLRLVFKELLSNAIKFVPTERAPKVSIEVCLQNRYVKIVVKDNGIGIDQRHHQQIFELFHKLELNSPGTGVGLAIVRNALDRMGGSVKLELTSEIGSSFSVTLPSP
jgi:signal transduction histidine kinase